MSARSLIADRLVELVHDKDLMQVYGGDVRQGAGKGKPYNVGFSRARVLDGEISVYSEKFIQVRWQTAYRDMPHTGSLVFLSEKDAQEFLTALADLDFQRALAVPTR
jgi:hypothetical protein